ncbi:MAG: nucleotidyltransferase domain-containing protein [Pseudomonadota bacterium]
MDLRTHIRKLIDEQGLSVRALSERSGVRRQSIAAFLADANLHLENLVKVLAALGQGLKITPLTSAKAASAIEKRFPVSRKALGKFCRGHGIRMFALFGSILRPDFKDGSDIDILIEFKKPVSLFELARIEEELKALIRTRHQLDVVTPGSLSPHLKDEILKGREVLYEEAA